MEILWPVVETIFKACEKCKKKEHLQENAVLLMVAICKIGGNLFFNERITPFIKNSKI